MEAAIASIMPAIVAGTALSAAGGALAAFAGLRRGLLIAAPAALALLGLAAR